MNKLAHLTQLTEMTIMHDIQVEPQFFTNQNRKIVQLASLKRLTVDGSIKGITSIEAIRAIFPNLEKLEKSDHQMRRVPQYYSDDDSTDDSSADEY